MKLNALMHIFSTVSGFKAATFNLKFIITADEADFSMLRAYVAEHTVYNFLLGVHVSDFDTSVYF